MGPRFSASFREWAQLIQQYARRNWVSYGTEGSAPEVLPLAPGRWRRIIGFSEQKSEMFWSLAGFCHFQTNRIHTLQHEVLYVCLGADVSLYRSWGCLWGGTGQLAWASRKLRGFCLGSLTSSVALGIESSFLFFFFFSIKKKKKEPYFCHLKLLNKEICPYCSIRPVQQTFRLFVSSNFLSTFWKSGYAWILF